MRFPLALALVAAGLLLGQAPSSVAGALRVSPVGLDLPPGRGAAVLTVRNDDDAPMNIQVRVLHWTQVGGEERLEPTNDVVASPPIAPLAPHTERIIRIVRVAPPSGAEQTYRVIVDELPPPPSLETHRIQLLLRHSIPLFFGAEDAGGARLSWTASANDQGLVLTGLNAGGRHLRVSNLKLLDAAGQTVAEHPGLVGYVLAGARTTWTLPVADRGRAVRLRADGDSGAIDVPLQPAP